MSKTIIQFGFRNVLHSMLQGKIVVDCRVLRNPYKHGVPDEQLREQVTQDPKFHEIVSRATSLLQQYDRVYIGCEFGRHRSGAVARAVAAATGADIKLL